MCSGGAGDITMSYATPKTDWDSSDLPTVKDLNRIEGNIQALQDEKNVHLADPTIHRTSGQVRGRDAGGVYPTTGTPPVIEVRSSAPASPARGRLWLEV